MKFSLSFIATIASATFAVAQQDGHWRFKLRATNYRGAAPTIGGYVDFDDRGTAGFARTSATFPSFVTYMDSKDPSTLPVGELHKEEGDVPAYLNPTETDGLYDLVFGEVPTGALHDEFAITDLACGGQCGGLQLVYAPGSSGAWAAYHDASTPSGFKIKYWKGPGAIPEGGQGVWLWRDSA